MLLKNKLRSVYSRAVHGNVIAIIDHDSGRSVTNDADNVIADLVSRGFDLSRYHVIYKDTRGIWDQILVDRTGCFCIRPIRIISNSVSVVPPLKDACASPRR